PKINFYRFYQSGKVPKNQFLSILPEWESPQKSIFIDFTRVGKSPKINFYRGCLKSGIGTQASLPANACKGGLEARTPTF
ncbi:MAG: hypothetical protein IIU11_11290, partial [Bacteroidales bacterium]|nr:hypothetical protein [Bacteroidales bacterium]